MSATRKPRAGTSALVAGITLTEEVVDQWAPRWRVRAVAQVDGRQQRASWSPTKHGLSHCVRQACEWRAARVPDGPCADDLEHDVWQALSPAVLSKMREAGVAVRRPRG